VSEEEYEGRGSGREDGLVEVVEKITRTIRTCMHVLGWRHRHDKTREAIEKVGADPALLVPEFFSSGFQLNHRVDYSFSLEARVYIELPSTFRDHPGVPVHALKVEVKWASGGGDIAKSLAQATIIRECVERAAQCETILRENLRELGVDQWLAAFKVLQRRKEAEWQKVRDYLGPE
jgi:hypothetical protein